VFSLVFIHNKSALSDKHVTVVATECRNKTVFLVDFTHKYICLLWFGCLSDTRTRRVTSSTHFNSSV